MSAPLRVGIVGCGNHAREHVRNFLATPDACITALCDIVPSQMDKFLAEFFADAAHKPRTFGGLRAMLDADIVDAVSIVTPHTLHFAQCMDCLDAGVHVLCEKPMVTDSGQARQLRDKVAATGKVLEIAFQGAHSVEHAYARDAIRSGALGELRVIDGQSDQGWHKGTRGKWRQDPALSGGGYLYDSGAHLLNGMVWLADSPIVEVFAMLDNRGCPVDIDGSVSVRFANGCIGSVAACGASPAGTWWTGMTVIGTEGILKLHTHNGRMEHYDGHCRRIDYPRVTQTGFSAQDGLVRMIRGSEPLRCGVDFGVRLADLMDAIYESGRTGRPAKPRFED